MQRWGWSGKKENRTTVQYEAGLFESAKWQHQHECVRTRPAVYCALLVYVYAFLVWRKAHLDILIRWFEVPHYSIFQALAWPRARQIFIWQPSSID